ncbi:hypothetical protein D3C71_1586650 [compost metagenome]
MHHNRAGKVVKLIPGDRFDPALHPKMVIPGDALEKRIHKTHNHRRRHQLRPELGALGNAPRHNGRNSRRKREQEEEFDEVVPTLLCQRFRPHKEVCAIGHPIAHHEIRHGGHGEIHQDLHQRIDLIFFANRAQLQKGEARVHGQYHDGPQQNEQGISALLVCLHKILVLVTDRFWCALAHS